MPVLLAKLPKYIDTRIQEWAPFLNLRAVSPNIHVDIGYHFTSLLWTPLTNLLGITLHQTAAACNLAANGMIECIHRTLKAALMSCSHTLRCGKIYSIPPDFQAPSEVYHIPKDLNSAMHVFLRNNTTKPPLTPPYTGPFLVIRRNPKAFPLNICGKEDWVSIDRLEPAYIPPDDPPAVRLSRSGRPI
ncbi:uncharacterized protein [Palaemon carinicauda]|uniref:uncharacterized protein n=1 Tax=Palaemon carinicauda TaxID=392227 RepID=UPI0035B60C24